MGKKSWSKNQLIDAVKSSFSIRQVIYKLGLIPAGGNYQHVTRQMKEMHLDDTHFTRQGWRKGRTIPREPVVALEDILKKGSYFSIHTLKKRLFALRLKSRECEECGWARISEDGRIPIELDHINGDRHDNRIENLRILCPNCHSLKPTHCGRNIKSRGGETGYTRGT